eukprot:CAMPEP_0119558380 /NCGR_PEP_ID=MMETSP1352-20130426/10754_1 /TAXON_ID=265584 /ORGANISM="Stauroneis constricta, Strain CCMP1120" /LENGTH=59 /DNA_ID=CAMNT_0007605725 /DNA_START=24 /DNA_END=200 /DNA_ORIENTATION=-
MTTREEKLLDLLGNDFSIKDSCFDPDLRGDFPCNVNAAEAASLAIAAGVVGLLMVVFLT